jgi:hypothetical protein
MAKRSLQIEMLKYQAQSAEKALEQRVKIQDTYDNIILILLKDKLPPLPPKNILSTDRSICGNVKGTKRCTQYQREYTPDNLINWMTKVCNELQKSKTT